jgi:hypothetical protein
MLATKLGASVGSELGLPTRKSARHHTGRLLGRTRCSARRSGASLGDALGLPMGDTLGLPLGDAGTSLGDALRANLGLALGSYWWYTGAVPATSSVHQW